MSNLKIRATVHNWNNREEIMKLPEFFLLQGIGQILTSYFSKRKTFRHSYIFRAIY
jgi:hypothetical protein